LGVLMGSGVDRGHYFFRRNAIKATSPPTTIIARITRNRLKIQAVPIPSAAHLPHQSPGDVIALMITKSTRTAGPTNKNFTARNIPDIIILIVLILSFRATDRAFSIVA